MRQRFDHIHTYSRVDSLSKYTGTGKTNTLVALLQSLVALKLRVHATAPTNVAVSELASRFLQASPHLRLGDILLVGTKDRLKVTDEENSLDKLLLDSRLDRYENAVLNFPRYASSFIAYIQRLINVINAVRDTDAYSSADDENKLPYQSFLNTVDNVLEVITFLHQEIPFGFVQNLQDSDVACIVEICQLFLESSETNLISWLEGNVEDNILSSYISKLVNTVGILRKISVKNVFNMKMLLMKEASIIFSTVNVSGRDLFQLVHFDVVVVDEATQLVEAETAIVLREQLKCMVLAGDDKQLPATIMSPLCQELGYGRSLFSRLLSQNFPYSLLNVQYRMHPSISRWPRTQFYGGEVSDGSNVLSEVYNKDWHVQFPPFVIYNIKFGKELSSVFGSKYNEAEAIVVRQLIVQIRALKWNKLTIGVISPYAEQVSILSHLATSASDPLNIKVNSVDGFQGQECDIIIFSAVRSNGKNGIGFLKDERRLNVAVTRAKYSLIVVCNVDTLSIDPTWCSLIEHARGQNALIEDNDNMIVKRAMKKWKKLDNSLAQCISSINSSWSHLTWKIIFTNDFMEAFKNIKEIKIREATIQCICVLGSGEWPKFELETKFVSLKYRGIIHERRFLHMKLIWSIDFCETTFTQRLIIWAIAVETSVYNAIRRVENYLNQYSEECLIRLARKEKCGKVYVPYAWSKEIPFRRMKDLTMKEATDELALERSGVGKAAALTKFYTMDGNVARRMLAMKEGQNIELPFVMSREEEEIVRRPGSVLVLGRSGTGKTTTLLHRMYFEEKCLQMNSDGIDERDGLCCKQLVVTASPILCDAIRRSYCNMCNMYDAKSESSINMDGDIVLPTSFVGLTKEKYPLIVTYSTFLFMLDQSIPLSYFKSRSQSERDKAHKMLSTLKELDSVTVEDTCNKTAFPRRNIESPANLTEVDFERFRHYYYPHFSEKLKNLCDVAAVYTEIMTNIKGSLKSLHTPNGYISEEDYMNLGNSRQSTLDSTRRVLMYEAFKKYQKLKTQHYGDYDQLDVIFYVYQSLSQNGYRGEELTSVYIDEVQDLCPAQIALFKFVCRNSIGYVFAGDTAQTVSTYNSYF